MLGWAIEWRSAEDLLQITEPTPFEVAAAAPQLAAFYNEPHNRRLLANTQTLTEGDVVKVRMPDSQAGLGGNGVMRTTAADTLAARVAMANNRPVGDTEPQPAA